MSIVGVLLAKTGMTELDAAESMLEDCANACAARATMRRKKRMLLELTDAGNERLGSWNRGIVMD